jgi:ribosome-associated toxin RatA of RatAB toxin-antitoxin module
MQSTLSVEIKAPAVLVFELARDLERWPALLPHYRDVRVLERHADGAITARMIAIRQVVPVLGYGVPVAWRARSWSEAGPKRIRFMHQGGATNGMVVTWRIEPTSSGCRVSIEHIFNPRVPGWASFVERRFVRPIATRTLQTFKAIAEAAAAHTPAPPATPPGRAPRRSGKPRSTKRAT